MTAFGDGDPIGKFDPRSTKMPVPAAGIFDEPFFCVPINVDWRGFLIGVIERLAWGDVWEGDADAQYGAVQEIYKLVSMMAIGGCEVALILRQDPARPCVMQYSNDDGESWEDAFDYSQCTAIATSETAESIQLNWNVSIAFNDATIVTYANDILNVAPAWDYGTPGDDDRDKALCYGLRAYVDMVCEAAIRLINDQNADTEELVGLWRNVAGAAGIMTGALAAVGLFPAAALVAGFSFALSSILVDIAATILASDAADYQDESARGEVACLMYGNLFGQIPARPPWRSSADSSLSGAAETIRVAVDQANQSKEAFVEFFMLFNDAVAVADSLPDCGCPEPVNPFVVTFDNLSTGDFEISWKTIPDWTETVPGVLQSFAEGNVAPSAKVSFGSDDVIGLPGINGMVRITLPEPRTVEDVLFEFYWTKPGTDVLLRRINLRDASEGLLANSETEADNAPKLTWTATWAWTGSEDMVKYIDCQIGVIGSGLTPGNTFGYIDNIDVS